MKSELNPWRLIHFHKLKVLADKYVSRRPGISFMQRYEKYMEDIYPTNGNEYRGYSDAYKSTYCFNP